MQLMPNPAAVKDMLRGKIKSESLRTYLLANARHYESLSLGLLREMFALDDKEVKRVVARMILSRELAASWNGDNLVMLLAVPSSLQVRFVIVTRFGGLTRPPPKKRVKSLSVQFSDKLRKLVESNELSLDRLTGGGGREQDVCCFILTAGTNERSRAATRGAAAAAGAADSGESGWTTATAGRAVAAAGAAA